MNEVPSNGYIRGSCFQLSSCGHILISAKSLFSSVRVTGNARMIYRFIHIGIPLNRDPSHIRIINFLFSKIELLFSKAVNVCSRNRFFSLQISTTFLLWILCYCMPLLFYYSMLISIDMKVFLIKIPPPTW